MFASWNLCSGIINRAYSRLVSLLKFGVDVDCSDGRIDCCVSTVDGRERRSDEIMLNDRKGKMLHYSKNLLVCPGSATPLRCPTGTPPNQFTGFHNYRQ